MSASSCGITRTQCRRFDASSASPAMRSLLLTASEITPTAQWWATATLGQSTGITGYTSIPGPTYAPSPVKHVIRFGADGLTYTPSKIIASIGDIVTLLVQVPPKNYTVTSPTLAKRLVKPQPPAKWLQVWIDFSQFVVPTGTNFPTFTITMDDTAPICDVESGPNNFDAFQKLMSTGDGSWAKVTATMTHGPSTWTTVYTSYVGTPYSMYAPSPVEHVIKIGLHYAEHHRGPLGRRRPHLLCECDELYVRFTIRSYSGSSVCLRAAETSTIGQVGFKSGSQFVPPTETTFSTLSITNDTAPIWGYCGQEAHCAAEWCSPSTTQQLQRASEAGKELRYERVGNSGHGYLYYKAGKRARRQPLD
ncbi:hypothetical protein DFH09DRAFT_1374659 [Mycena vulgaris]|nr:hypothetical protein DFH09DRAFT_1374659 [Mycena vulgaris]